MIAPDVARIIILHRRAFWSQWTRGKRWRRNDLLIVGGVAVVILSPLIGLAIGVAVWGWPQ